MKDWIFKWSFECIFLPFTLFCVFTFWLFVSESESCWVVSHSLRPHGLYSPWHSPGQNTGVASHSLLQGIFPTQGLNPGLLHCRQILYQLSHKGSLVAIWPFINKYLWGDYQVSDTIWSPGETEMNKRGERSYLHETYVAVGETNVKMTVSQTLYGDKQAHKK